MSTTYPIKDKYALGQFKSYYLFKKNPRNYALIITGLNTALRISDILMLKWGDLYDYSKKAFKSHIYLTEQKTGKESIIAVNGSLSGALTLLFEHMTDINGLPAAEDYLFTSKKISGCALSRYQAYRIIREAAKHSGIEGHISCHSLRKTFGYFAWKQGIPPAMLMNIYNHSSYQITKRYLCIEQEDRDEVFLKIII